MPENLINKQTENNVSYSNNFSGFSKVDPVDMSTILLNFTWTLFLVIIASAMSYFAWEVVKQMREKRITDRQLFDQFKKQDGAIHKLTNDLDNLGKKVRNLEQHQQFQDNQNRQRK